MNVLLLQLDGKLPNIALMRISSHHRALGDHVELRKAGNARAVQPELYDSPDRIYASLIFERTRPVAEALLHARPDAIVGGTGWSLSTRLSDYGIETLDQDYELYPGYAASIGFTQRGCRLKCPFCVVPKTEGKIADEQSISDLWRGDPHPRHIVLLDNDFFGQPQWRSKIDEIRNGFRVNFNQGINARVIDEEVAAAVASVDYRDERLRYRRLHTAWDNAKDEKRLFRGLELLVEAGIKPDHLMVYMLVGYWPGETHGDRDYRRAKLRDFGARPYPMPYKKDPEIRAFCRWVIGAYDKKIPWETWTEARGEPRRLRLRKTTQLPIFKGGEQR